MEICLMRPAHDQFWLTIRFPCGETLDGRIARSQLLEQLDIES
jgi:hypothetical protein